MTDETLRTMLGFFPVMLVVTAIETTTLRRREYLNMWVLACGSLGLLATVTGTFGALLELGARESGIHHDDVSAGVWVAAFVSIACAFAVAMVRLSEWRARAEESQQVSSGLQVDDA